MFMISRWSLVVIFIISTVIGSFLYGRSFERTQTLVQAISTFQNREKINNETFALSPFSLCRALGGMPEECADVLRRVDTTTDHQ
ncbi:hypothetical protein [Bartonella ancashensis]|uniref:Uncharacterized protein n=1 Tax=Bartonella ancashensis TaxID=1318743 RepID=A0A0M4LRX4_9HYPH|nr:hypothetical protein [Bartonella ancashensis]ALE03059.1 hypothetical protein PU02_0245 [Bartonella ancashensis]